VATAQIQRTDHANYVELHNTGNNDPRPRYFTHEAISGWRGTLEELWRLTSGSYAPAKSSTDRPYTSDHLAMAGENIKLLNCGEPIWRWQRFMTSPKWQSWGTGRRIGDKVHLRNGCVETVYAG